MSTPSLVAINTAGADELAALHGIGPVLAGRIAAHRDAHGPITTPDDLARVPGVSAELAYTLAPRIDWRAPAATGAGEKERDWVGAATRAIPILVCLWFVRNALANVLHLWPARGQGEPFALGWLVANIAALTIGLSGTLGVVLRLLADLTRDRARAKRLNRVAFLSLIPVVAGMVVGVLSIAVYYQFYAPGGWARLLDDSGTMAGLVCILAALAILLPMITLLWWPALAYNAVLARAVDGALLLGALAGTAMSWFAREEVPVLISIVLGVFGLSLAALGYQSIRGREPYLSLIAELLLPAPDARRQADATARLAWLNARMPDPEEQKALQAALNRAYPPSRKRTLMGLLVFGAGGWLVITALGAIVEYVVQGWVSNWVR